MQSKNVWLALVVCSWFLSLPNASAQQPCPDCPPPPQPEPIPLPEKVREVVRGVVTTVVNTLDSVEPPTAPSQRRILEEPVARVEFAPTQRVTTRSRQNIFQTVGLLPTQSVQVTVAYPIAMAGQIVRLEVLDGGRLLIPIDHVIIGKLPTPPPIFDPEIQTVITEAAELLVDAAGTITFAFRAGLPPGLYQVRMSSGNQEWGLPFYALDRTNPRNNPPVLSPAPTPPPTTVPTPPPIPKPSIPPPLPSPSPI